MDKQLNRDALVEAIFALLLGVLFGYAIFAATNWPYKAALFPKIVGLPGLILALAVAVFAFRRARKFESARPQAGTATDLVLDESLLGTEGLKRTGIIFNILITRMTFLRAPTLRWRMLQR